MPRYAIVQDNFIVNVIVADDDFIAANCPDAVKCDESVGVGDKYEDGVFTRVVVTADAETL